MNIQAMMKQAQKLQKDMVEQKKIIDETVYTGKSSIVEVAVMGNKKIKSIKINSELIEKDEIEMLEDMLLVAINDSMNQIDKDQNAKMGKYTQGMPGLF